MGLCSSSFRILVLGLTGSGKTTLLRSIDAISSAPRPASLSPVIAPTICHDHATAKLDSGVTLMFDELAANAATMENWPEFFRDRDALVWMLDISNPEGYTKSLDTLRNTLRGAKGSIPLDKSVLVILVLNKIDVWEKFNKDPIITEAEIIKALRAPKRYIVSTTSLCATELDGCRNFLVDLSEEIAQHKDLALVRLARRFRA